MEWLWMWLQILAEVLFLPNTKKGRTKPPPPPPLRSTSCIARDSLLQLLLGSKLVGATALLLTAVVSSGVKASIALSADELVAVVLSGQDLKGRLDHTSSQAKNKVKGGFCSEGMGGQRI